MKYTKYLIDGHCECANCGKRISGIQNYNLKHEDFVCEECKKEGK